MRYRPGAKPVRKILVGQGAAEWLHVGYRLLRNLYRNDAAVLEAVAFPKPDVTVRVLKHLSHDLITIRVLPIGFVVSLVYRYFDSGIEGFGGGTQEGFIYGQEIYRAPLLTSSTWTKVGGVTVAGDDGYGHPTLTADSANFYVDGLFFGRPYENSMVAFKGGIFQAKKSVYDAISPFSSYNTINNPQGTFTFISTDALETVTKLPLQFTDSDSFSGAGHLWRPVLIGGERYLYFALRGNAGTVLYIYDVDADSAQSVPLQEAVNASAVHPAVFDNLEPKTVFGWQGSPNNVFPAFYFVLVGTTLTRILSSPYLNAANAAPENGIQGRFPSITPLGPRTALFGVPAPVAGDSRPRNFYRIEIAADGESLTETLVLSVAVIAGYQALNLGGGCIVILGSHIPLFTPEGVESGDYESLRWVSKDYGRTFIESPLAVPRDLYNAGILNPVLPVTPYLGDSSPGSIYALSDYVIASAEADSGAADVVVSKSMDQGESWTDVSTVALRADAPPPVLRQGYSDSLPPTAQTLQILAPGTPGNPQPIDLIHPWRCDDSYPPSLSWIAQ